MTIPQTFAPHMLKDAVNNNKVDEQPNNMSHLKANSMFSPLSCTKGLGLSCFHGALN